MSKRAFILVLDSFGIGATNKEQEPYNDQGSNTLLSISKSKKFNIKNLKKMGLFNIDGNGELGYEPKPTCDYARLVETSVGKDSTTGHFEMAGIITKKPFKTYPEGFPAGLVKKLQKAFGKPILCNKPYSGTQVILDYGKEHMQTGNPIVYTSADSVLQIACHTSVVPLQELYNMCEKARKICKGKYKIARIIARPFSGEYPNFIRTADRHDYSILPPKPTMLDKLKQAGKDVIAVGKIGSLFAERGVTLSVPTKSDKEGLEKLNYYAQKDFDGLCFVNLVDFDQTYGHRNNVDGYALNLNMIDDYLPEIISNIDENELFIITADHGCDPATVSTDHSRENVPLLIYQKSRKGVNLGTINGFNYISDLVLNFLLKD